MIKKIMMVLALVTLVFSASFADVYIKDIDGTNVDIVFTFKDDSATEMNLIGDFCGWVEPGTPMAKNADGKWEVTLKSTMDSTIKYKFWYKGTYIYDFKSPDKIDDGFGGNNGLIEVSKALSKQKAKELAASGDAAGAAALMASAGGDSALKFASWSMLGFQTKMTLGDTTELASAGLNLKSYWKVSGEAVPHMPLYIEVAVAEQDGFTNLYEKDVKEWKDGLSNLLVDTIFDPIYYYGGQASEATYLGHFKAGFSSDYVEYVTGYKYAKLPPHTNVSWTTIDQEWEAGYQKVGGFSQFSLGATASETIKEATGVKINAVVAPNRSADRAGGRYGMYAYATAEFAGQYVDFQYNGAYGTEFDTLFDTVYEADFILGYKGAFGPVTVLANGLLNMYGSEKVSETNKSLYSPSTSDVGLVNDAPENMIDNFAANVQVQFSNDFIDATAAYRARGVQANMMYVEEGKDDHTNISDQLGDLNTQKIWANVNYKGGIFNVGVEPYVIMNLNKDAKLFYVAADADKESMEIGGKLFGAANLDVVSFDAYANVKYISGLDEDAEAFTMGDCGIKVSTPLVLNGLSLTYGYDNDDANAVFHTAIFELGLPLDINAQAGFGLRTAKEDSTVYEGKEFGFFVGANKKLNIPQKPVVYTQFVYNMDPYKAFGDGQDNLNLDGYVTDNGVANYVDAAAFRVAIKWDI